LELRQARQRDDALRIVAIGKLAKYFLPRESNAERNKDFTIRLENAAGHPLLTPNAKRGDD